MTANPDPTISEGDLSSPLVPQPYQDDRVERRRGGPRVRAVLPITFRLVRPGSSDALAGHTRDIAERGLSLKLTRALPVGASFLIYLNPGPPDEEPLSLLYRVTRCLPAGESEDDGFLAAAALVGRAGTAPQPPPPLTPRDILRRLRVDEPRRT